MTRASAATLVRLPLLRIIQCDGYIVYPSWAKDKAWIKLMGCHSHVRRKFFEATDQSPRLVGWILRQLAHLYRIEARLRETKAGPALRQAVRAAESRMIHRRLRKAIGKLALRSSILPKSKLGKAIGYVINQWPNLETYLDDGRVEICNNLVENAIRPTKLGAKTGSSSATKNPVRNAPSSTPLWKTAAAWPSTPRNISPTFSPVCPVCWPKMPSP